MGSYIELNYILQITKEQGFPKELDLERHKINLYKVEDFKDMIFEFKNKSNIRNYQMPPVNNILVQNIDGKWLYWGLVHILEVTHDYVNKTTSGKFKIVYINSPEEMNKAHKLIDGNESTFYEV